MKMFRDDLWSSNPHRSGLILCVLATMVVFISSSIYANYKLGEIDKITKEIRQTALPSISYLAATGNELSDILTLIDDAHSQQGVGSESIKNAITKADKDIEMYLKLDMLPGENDLWLGVRDELTDVTKKIRLLEQKIIKGEIATPETKKEINDARVAIGHARNQLFKTIQHDLLATQNLSRTIGAIHEKAEFTRFVLGVIGIFLTIIILFAVILKLQKFDRLTKIQENRIQEQVNELKQFTGRVSHDLRSPLAVIVSSLEIYSMSDDSKKAEYLDMARRNSIRALGLVENLLGFANAGGQSDISKVTNVHKIFENLKDVFLASAESKNIQLTFECNPQTTIRCGENLFFSAMANLIGNAQKYMGDSKIRKIEVSAEEKDKYVLIFVKDTGPGIAAHFRDKIFEPFVRGDHQEVEGYGLGLATVRKIVIAHGGSVHLESEVGKGSCFQLKFPRFTS